MVGERKYKNPISEYMIEDQLVGHQGIQQRYMKGWQNR